MTPRRALTRAVFGLTLLTGAATFGLSVDDGSRQETTDRALSVLLLTTLPLAVCFAVWSAGKTEDQLIAFGQNRRKSSLSRLGPLLLGLPLSAVVLSAAVLVWTRGPHDPSLAVDLVSTAPVALMAAAALCLSFVAIFEWFGSLGLLVLLLVLLTFGQTELLAAAALPSAHVRHLLGVGATLPFDPGWSMAALWLYSALAGWAWLGRVRP